MWGCKEALRSQKSLYGTKTVLGVLVITGYPKEQRQTRDDAEEQERCR